MGWSIFNVFNPIEENISKRCDVERIMFDNSNFTLKAIFTNVRRVRAIAKKNPEAIIHITGTENYLLYWLKKYKTIVTVCDLGFYTQHPKNIRQYMKCLLLIKPIKYAKYVSFISQKTMEETEEYIKLDNKIVISCPVNDAFFEPYTHTFNEQEPVLLMIGTRKHKNVERVVEAISGLKCKLKVIGKLTEEQLDKLYAEKIDFTEKINLKMEQMLEEYRSCDLVVFPSVYEGFGLPIIEGQALGKSVVTSDIPPMNEIAGTGAVLVNPNSVESIKNGIQEAIEKHLYYEKQGKANSQNYTVDKISDMYYELYEKVANK